MTKKKKATASVAAGKSSKPAATRSSDRRVPFSGRIAILGCGAISQCLQPLLLRHLDMDFSKLTIVEKEDLRDTAAEMLSRGARFLRVEITRDNLDSILRELVGPGDMVIDLAWNIDTVDIVDWCQRHDVRYLNTSIEVWEPYLPNNGKSADDDTIYARHVKLSEYVNKMNGGRATAIIEHGANPGLVNHWTKLGLEHIATRLLAQVPMSLARRAALENAYDQRDYARLARLTGTKVIHISERDTQKSKLKIDYEREFVSTWSVDSFYQESVSAAELAWGTHELKLPPDAVRAKFGPGNKIHLKRTAIQTLAYSWVPSGQIVGHITPHGEVFSISKKLTLKEVGEVVYRPTVYFVYRPIEEAAACLQRLRMQKTLQLPPECRVITDEITHGNDEVGVLLMGHDFNGWWIGSTLDIHEARRHVPEHNATTLQVAASVLSGIIYALNHPEEGIRTADDLPHSEILPIANPYLGPCPSIQTSWLPPPLRGKALRRDLPDSWQFEHFLFQRPEPEPQPMATKTWSS